jgi:CheY-like chemotaxis protein
VAVQSTVNAGSTFTMILPCTIVASPLARPTAMTRDPEHGAHPRAAILIAEDNDINRELVTQMLARLGHEGITVSNGREAVAAAQARTFDLILMDIQMPEMDGVSAAAAIRALPGEHGSAPIVAVTANAMVGDRERYLAGGFDDYLAKPLHLDQLQDVIVRWTHKPHGPAEPSGSQPVMDGARVSQIRNSLSDGELAALAERLPKELDAQIDRARHAIRANDADGVRVALRALHDSAAAFGLRELADLSDRLAHHTTDLDRMVGQSAAIQDAVTRAKSGIAEVLAASRVTKE